MRRRMICRAGTSDAAQASSAGAARLSPPVAATDTASHITQSHPLQPSPTPPPMPSTSMSSPAAGTVTPSTHNNTSQPEAPPPAAVTHAAHTHAHTQHTHTHTHVPHSPPSPWDDTYYEYELDAAGNPTGVRYCPAAAPGEEPDIDPSELANLAWLLGREDDPHFTRRIAAARADLEQARSRRGTLHAVDLATVGASSLVASLAAVTAEEPELI